MADTSRILSRTVWVLSLVSLCTDVASEMLYPVMPVYLRSVGFTALAIGMLEGLAECIAGIGKGYFGNLSDRMGRRLPFVRWGYGLSAISKPMLALFTFPVWIFGARSLDRLGKGLRTGARDALLSAEATPATQGRIFGFHRAMDTTGAILGPLLALGYLWYAPGQYKPLFMVAFVPGALAVALLWALRERRQDADVAKAPYRFGMFISFWRHSTPQYRKLVAGLLVFALCNSSDYFLLLRLHDHGFTDVQVIGFYVFYNILYAAASYPLGGLADRYGARRVLCGGLLVFALVYAGMALPGNAYWFLGVFALYGLYAAATDGVSKAWTTSLCRKEETGTALGTLAAFQSIGALGAGALAGALWTLWGFAPVFLVAAVAAPIVAAYLYFALPAAKTA